MSTQAEEFYELLHKGAVESEYVDIVLVHDGGKSYTLIFQDGSEFEQVWDNVDEVAMHFTRAGTPGDSYMRNLKRITASPADTATPPKAPNSNRRSHSDSPRADRP